MGIRPIDFHVSALKKLGCEFKEMTNGKLSAVAHYLRGEQIVLDYPSVGATENIMLSAVVAEGETTIINPAREPEIINLQDFLNKAGFYVSGAGTNKIIIKGDYPKSYVEHSIIPDRIEAGTFLYAAAISRGAIMVGNVFPEDMLPVLECLKKMGCRLHVYNDYIKIFAPERLNELGAIRTSPHPGFPTDMQPQTTALFCVAKGTSLMTESVFEKRFSFVSELMKMGADIKIRNSTAVIKGVDALSPARLQAKDLRGGAALVLAALGTKGKTEITGINFIERGYENFTKKLQEIGANIIEEG